ncbi:MAG: hypothetical protein GY822_11490 [Deltaproteobacteria bacterium]|nr:hypothetical protein [Deltaproteobacteria bacterium]
MNSLVTRSELKIQRQHLREQQRVQKEKMHASLKVQLEMLRKDPLYVAAQEKRLRRRRRRQLMVLLVILLLLLQRCDCEGVLFPDAPVVVEAMGPPAELAAPGELKDQPPRKPPYLRGKVKTSKRPSLAVKPPPPPSWLAQFRLQVATRSPRLAACFNGNDQPGAMRWSALVHAKSGRVYEAVVEPAFRGSTLTQKQVDCLVEGLTEKRYHLDEKNPQAAARRISLIFEF